LCNKVEREVCKDVPVDDIAEECQDVPREVCQDVEREVCQPKENEVCQEVPREVVRQDCKTMPQQVTH